MGLTIAGVGNNLADAIAGGKRAGNVLDGLFSSQTSFAASPRKLRSGYVGPSMRVRRSSDNLEVDIGFSSTGDLDTVALLAHVGANSGFVSKLYDQSGLGRDLLQATAANQPRIVNAGVVDRMSTGKTMPMLVTDGVSQYMQAALFVVNQPLTLNVVTQIKAITAFKRWLGVSGPQMYIGGSSNFIVNGGADLVVAAVVAVNDTAVVTGVLNGAGSVCSYNGAITAGNAGAGNMADAFTLAATVAGASFANAGYGDILIFPSALSASDRISLESNQKAYYGTP